MTDEILKDAELEKVVGGSGIETIALMARLQKEGLATFTTPLIVGNEKAAAQELKTYFDGLKINDLRVDIHSDNTPNSYSTPASLGGRRIIVRCNPVYNSISEDDVVGLVKKHFGIV